MRRPLNYYDRMTRDRRRYGPALAVTLLALLAALGGLFAGPR